MPTVRRFVQAIESRPLDQHPPAETLAVMRQYAPAPIDAAKIVRTTFTDRLDIALISPFSTRHYVPAQSSKQWMPTTSL